MELTDRQLNRSTLSRQLLLHREPMPVVDAIVQVVGLQIQSAASPYLALAARVAAFDPGDVDAAFAEGTVVKASLLRVTLHAVTATDYPVIFRAMEDVLRSARLADPERVRVGERYVHPDELVAQVVALAAEPQPASDLRARFEELTGQQDPRLWRAVRTFAPLHHVPDGGPWSFSGTAGLVAAPDPGDPSADRLECVAGLLRRYLRGFGPASLRDFAQFTMLPMARVRAAVAEAGDDLVEYSGPDGQPLLDIPGATLTDPDAPAAPRLLGMWDNTLLAYADRARILPAEFRADVIRRNGDVLPSVLVDGRVAGVWRAVDGGIEVSAFRRLNRAAWAGIEAEAASLQALLAVRDPDVYRRHAHWWDKGLPTVRRTVVPA